MKRMADADLRRQFLGWQCRIRQMACRNFAGAPPPGARPRTLEPSGTELMAAMTVLLVPRAPQQSTAFLKFQVARNNDPRAAYEAGLRYLAAEFYQDAELFSDELTALFAAGIENGPDSPRREIMPSRLRAVLTAFHLVMPHQTSARRRRRLPGNLVAQPHLQPGGAERR